MRSRKPRRGRPPIGRKAMTPAQRQAKRRALVAYFLESTPKKNTERNRQLLAQHIQDEIEDWILFMLLPGDKEEA